VKAAPVVLVDQSGRQAGLAFERRHSQCVDSDVSLQVLQPTEVNESQVAVVFFALGLRLHIGNGELAEDDGVEGGDRWLGVSSGTPCAGAIQAR
jgi:hypothetical protein